MKLLETVEKRWIYKALKRFNNHKAKAAEWLGISTKTLYNKLQSYNKQDLTSESQTSN